MQLFACMRTNLDTQFLNFHKWNKNGILRKFLFSMFVVVLSQLIRVLLTGHSISNIFQPNCDIAEMHEDNDSSSDDYLHLGAGHCISFWRPADAHARLVCQSNLLPAEYNQFIVRDPLSNVDRKQAASSL